MGSKSASHFDVRLCQFLAYVFVCVRLCLRMLFAKHLKLWFVYICLSCWAALLEYYCWFNEFALLAAQKEWMAKERLAREGANGPVCSGWGEGGRRVDAKSIDYIRVLPMGILNCKCHHTQCIKYTLDTMARGHDDVILRWSPGRRHRRHKSGHSYFCSEPPSLRPLGNWFPWANNKHKPRERRIEV